MAEACDSEVGAWINETGLRFPSIVDPPFQHSSNLRPPLIYLLLLFNTNYWEIHFYTIIPTPFKYQFYSKNIFQIRNMHDTSHLIFQIWCNYFVCCELSSQKQK